MEQRYSIAGTPEVKVPIRARGMSTEHRFFDEDTSTSSVTQDFIVIRLRGRVDLDSELHITSMRTQIGGTFRVAWINTRPQQGMYSVGLELLDPEGEIWEPVSIPAGLGSGEAVPVALLECQRCYQRVSLPVPEAEKASLGEGFILARHCDTCRATTGWAFRVGKTAEEVLEEARRVAETTVVAEPVNASTPGARGTIDQRKKGRAPIELAIKIVRTKYGRPVTDVCKTINVSRSGVYFATQQGYDVGEEVQVILPYHPDSIAIPVRARVVRQDRRPGTLHNGVAIHLTSASPSPS